MANKESESNTTRGQGQAGLQATATKTLTKAVATTPVAVVSPVATKITATAQPGTARSNKLTGAAINTSGH